MDKSLDVQKIRDIGNGKQLTGDGECGKRNKKRKDGNRKSR